MKKKEAHSTRTITFELASGKYVRQATLQRISGDSYHVKLSSGKTIIISKTEWENGRV
jgi:hypothetical protein